MIFLIQNSPENAAAKSIHRDDIEIKIRISEFIERLYQSLECNEE